jgi:multicomponent Na+:H+ antiporter subunit C
MTASLTLALLVGLLSATGVYLLLSRSIVRALLGLLLLGNGANILFLFASGQAGRAPIVGTSEAGEMSDPLPQAMVLTAIVITLGVTAFVLSLVHRSWQLGRSEVVENDPEDVRILTRTVDQADGEFSAEHLSDEELARDPAPDPDARREAL